VENSIEEDIKVLENLLDEGFEAMCYEEAQAIEHILSDYKRLREYYEEQNEVNAKFIAVQKVKDKIKELENKIKYEQNAQVLVQLYKQIKVLQELLEGRE
jgi:hypothetical protein